MPKTISFHNGTSWSRGHNARDKRYTSKQEHIDPELSKNNITMRDVSAREAYQEIFGEAVEEYNARQKRADRKIGNYYDKIKADKRKHTVYEAIVQIGDSRDTGNKAEQEKLALERFVAEWDKRNPNLYLIGAYIHADEPNGTVHAHLDYIPVAECSKGLRLQNSYDKALQQQGFKTENIHKTAQIAWQDREREALCSICRELNIDVQHNQKVSGGREHLSKREYIRARTELNEELKPLKDELTKYEQMKVETLDYEEKLEEKKQVFSDRVSVPSAQLQEIKEQARAYRANRDDFVTLKEREQELNKLEESLKARQAQLERRKKELDDMVHRANERFSKAVSLYESQLNLNNKHNKLIKDYNKLVDDIHSMHASLTAERLENTKKGETIQELQKRLREATEATRGAYETVAGAVKAVSMLVYSNSYSVNLTKEQIMLVDSVRDYAEYWASRDGFDDIAEDIKSHYGLTKGVKSFLDDRIEESNRQNRPKSRGMERG